MNYQKLNILHNHIDQIIKPISIETNKILIDNVDIQNEITNNKQKIFDNASKSISNANNIFKHATKISNNSSNISNNLSKITILEKATNNTNKFTEIETEMKDLQNEIKDLQNEMKTLKASNLALTQLVMSNLNEIGLIKKIEFIINNICLNNINFIRTL